jgi:hypothetical protein
VHHLLDDLRIKIVDFISLFVLAVPFEKGPEDGRLVGQDGPVAVDRRFVVVRVTIIICPGPLVHSMGKMSWRNGNGEEGPHLYISGLRSFKLSLLVIFFLTSAMLEPLLG